MTDIHGNVCTHQNIGGRASTTSAVNGELDNSFRLRVVGDYNPLINHPRINNIELIGNKTSADLGIPYVFCDTTANWTAQYPLITIDGAIYIYSDYKKDEYDRNVPGIKVGDGVTSLENIPFVMGESSGGGGDVSQIKIGSVTYDPVDGVITLPVYPTVNNGSLTIRENGVDIQTFTANQASNIVADISVPTKVSELVNDSGYTSNVGTVTGVKIGDSSYSPSDGVVNLPDYPTVNNGALTIQKNGTDVQTFTSNQSTNVTANITVPTKVSELTNDSGYTSNVGTVTNVKVGDTSYPPTNGVVNLPDYPEVPTKVSELINDSGYTTNLGTVTTVKIGDVPYTPSEGIVSLPAYPEGTNTHRPIQMDDVEILGNNEVPLNLKAGDNVSLSNVGGDVTINAVDTTYESKPGVENGTDVSLVTTGEKYYWNHIGGGGGGGTVTSIATGAGLTGGPISMSGTIKANLKSETASALEASAMGNTANRQYAVGLDRDGVLSVNIPWTDNNTQYSPTKESIGSASLDTPINITINGLVSSYSSSTPTSVQFAPDSCNLIVSSGRPSRLTQGNMVLVLPNISVSSVDVVTDITPT